MTARLLDYPEYRSASWNLPEGNLYGDQRHRARIWGTYALPLREAAGALDLSLLFSAASGVPYGMNGATTTAPGVNVGQIDPRPYVLNPGYANPLQSTALVDYFFFARDRYRTEAQYRTDLSANYKRRVVGRAEAFVHVEVLNVFNQFQLCGCGGTVFNNGGGSDVRQITTGVQTRATAGASSGLTAFNPFTETSVDRTCRRLADIAVALGNSANGEPSRRGPHWSRRAVRHQAGVG